MTEFLASLAAVYGADDLTIDAFRAGPILLPKRLDHLAYGYHLAPKGGTALEFGVFQGGSINFLARLDPKRTFDGFDSFEGLPEAWERSASSTYEAGHFALPGLPEVEANVRLHKGFFDRTVGPWVEANEGPVDFLHLDGDLYSSAIGPLQALDHRLRPGSVIVFDELCDWRDEGVYPLWREGEWRALQEWLGESGRKVRVLGRDGYFSAAIQIVDDDASLTSLAGIARVGDALWSVGARAEAVGLLGELVARRSDWAPWVIKLAQWRLAEAGPDTLLQEFDGLTAPIMGEATEDAQIKLARVRARALLGVGQPEAAEAAMAPATDAETPLDAQDWLILAEAARRRKDHKLALERYQTVDQMKPSEHAKRQIADMRWRVGVRPEFAHLMHSSLILQEIVDRFEFKTVLDVGSGAGLHAAAMRSVGKQVTEVDLGGSNSFEAGDDERDVIVADFLTHDFGRQFDCLWASHVLEHQPNVNLFLQKAHEVLREGGVLAITVPPAKPKIVGGHLTLWNAGLLLYNLVFAGFDCREAIVRSYGYNISVAVRKRSFERPPLVMDNGDIDRLAPFFPPGFGEGFDGDISMLN